ncbi:hypothetical protein ACMD2_22443 [Ananas comosus]|uniref:Uncharacterized protein n=1 Tax=Ananas comosus TaxID=4615 RepID=A0A199UYC3_ANACO|nr:hypothetical protein ACMD2_22443 [Ananas comosus]
MASMRMNTIRQIAVRPDLLPRGCGSCGGDCEGKEEDIEVGERFSNFDEGQLQPTRELVTILLSKIRCHVNDPVLLLHFQYLLSEYLLLLERDGALAMAVAQNIHTSTAQCVPRIIMATLAALEGTF